MSFRVRDRYEIIHAILDTCTSEPQSKTQIERKTRITRIQASLYLPLLTSQNLLKRYPCRIGYRTIDAYFTTPFGYKFIYHYKNIADLIQTVEVQLP
jgi:predicted transcriptional regulator